ncbi:MAG: hypothetical protein AMXMBFR84_15630 [Candidatus Hydrogenedentota bacterium]
MYLRIVPLLLVCMTSAWCQFPMAGGNAQRTGEVAVDGPLSEPTILWEFTTDIVGESLTQPVVDEAGNVYATAAPAGGEGKPRNYEGRGILVSISPKGKERWRYTWQWDPATAGYPASVSQLSVPALTRDGGIVMGFRFGWIRCFERNSGALRWERHLTHDLDPITSALLVDEEGSIYVYPRDTDTVQKLNPRDGEPLWIHRFPDGATGNASSPALSTDQETMYIGRTANKVAYLYAVNTADGSDKWAWSPEQSEGHSFAWSIPAVDVNGTIYIQCEEFGLLYAIGEAGRTHARKWIYRVEGKGALRLRAMDASGVYSSYMAPAPVLYALDLDGKERWRKVFDRGIDVSGLVAGKDLLFFGLNGTGTAYAVEKATGKTRWSKAVGKSDGGFSEGMALSADGTLFTGVNGTMQHPDNAVVVALR